MISLDLILLASYFLVLGVLALYGWHRYYLLHLYRAHRANVPAEDLPLRVHPRVTIQLPVFNEMYVVERLIDAACGQDYPRDRFEIQVLDDSTDETRDVAAAAVARHAARGMSISHVHRTDRTGFKAGALEAGLREATGEFVAIFDADFVPAPDFLRRTLPHFGDPHVGLVQARWGHINRAFSLLTQIQSIMLDGHFVIEHGARHRAGCFFNFNGTAGIWRRTAIEDAGGWQHDTLTEDLDLSYRAQLAGWRFVFLPHVVSPAEVPVEMNAFKAQQRRWAKGSIQTCRKLLPRILRSSLPLRIKAEAFVHLTANVNYVLMVLLSLLIVPAMYVRQGAGWRTMWLVDAPLFCAATLSIGAFYTVCLREIHTDWVRRLRYLPLMMSVGIGLCVNNARAVLEGLGEGAGEFERTAKYGVERIGDEWRTRRYRRTMALQPFVETGIGLYFTGAAWYAGIHALYATLPFLILFQVGFLYTGVLSLVQQCSPGVPALAPQADRVPREAQRPIPVRESLS